MADSKIVDICILGDQEKAKIVCETAKEFGYSCYVFPNLDEVFESAIEPNLIVMIEDLQGSYKIDEVVQAGRQVFPNAFPILAVERELTKEKSDFLERQGVKQLLLRREIETSKVPFLLSYYLKANFIPLKSIDLVANFEIPFSIYHLMPQKKKFLKILKAGNTLDEERLKRLLENPEFYIERSDMMAFKKYIEKTAERSAKGLQKKCRANFVALQTEFSNFVLEVTGEASRISLTEGQTLLVKCRKLCEDLLANMAEFPNIWEIVDSSSIGEFGSLERSPAIAAFAGMIAIRSDIDSVTDIMMNSLLCDMGILSLPLNVSRKLREQGPGELSADETDLYVKVPHKSIEYALGRKLAIPEKQRSIILGIYENADGTGINPHAPPTKGASNVTIESQVIRFAKEFDSAIQVRLGVARRDPIATLNELPRDHDKRGVFSTEFINSVWDKVVTSYQQDAS